MILSHRLVWKRSIFLAGFHTDSWKLLLIRLTKLTNYSISISCLCGFILSYLSSWQFSKKKSVRLLICDYRVITVGTFCEMILVMLNLSKVILAFVFDGNFVFNSFQYYYGLLFGNSRVEINIFVELNS